MNQLKADNLLRGSWILDEIKKFSDGLRYEDEEQVFSYKTFYNLLLKAVNTIPSLGLQPVVAPGTSRAYLIDLTSGLETVLDRIEVTFNRVLFFQSKVKSATLALKNLRDTFKVWYLISIQGELKNFDIKLSSKSMESLADSEFNRLLGESGSDLEALDIALNVLSDQLKGRKKLAQEKYSIGKDQANASLLPMLGAQAGYQEGRTGEELLREKYGLGERASMVLDDPPENFRIATKKSLLKTLDPAPITHVQEVSFDVEDIEEAYPQGLDEVEEDPKPIDIPYQDAHFSIKTYAEEPVPDFTIEQPQSHFPDDVVETVLEENVTISELGPKSKRRLMFDDEEETPSSSPLIESNDSVETTPEPGSRPEPQENLRSKRRRITFED
jgi:hypothetical protein